MNTAAVLCQNEKIADEVMDGIRGQTLGKSFIEEARQGFLDPDALYSVMHAVSMKQSSANFRGLCRAIQKHLERS